MITSKVNLATIEEWKNIYNTYSKSLHPNRKSGNEVLEYFKEKYPCIPFESNNFKNIVESNIVLNNYSKSKLKRGTPKISTYTVDDVLVGIDETSGEFHVECPDIQKAAKIYDDLFTYRGLDKRDLKNYVLVAQYVLLTNKK